MQGKADEKPLFVGEDEAIMLMDDFGDWLVTKKDVKKFKELWNDNVPFVQMCRRLDMPGVKLLLLIADQSCKGLIGPRKIGIGI